MLALVGLVLFHPEVAEVEMPRFCQEAREALQMALATPPRTAALRGKWAHHRDNMAPMGQWAPWCPGDAGASLGCSGCSRGPTAMTECCSMLKPELWDILGLAGLIQRSSNNPLRHHRARCSAWNFCSSTLRQEAQNQRMESGDLGTLGWRRRDIAVLPFHTVVAHHYLPGWPANVQLARGATRSTLIIRMVIFSCFIHFSVHKMAHDFIYFNESGESKHPKMIQNACTTCLFLLVPFAYCAQVIKDQATGEDWCVMARRRVQLSWKGVYRPTTFINILLLQSPCEGVAAQDWVVTWVFFFRHMSWLFEHWGFLQNLDLGPQEQGRNVELSWALG